MVLDDLGGTPAFRNGNNFLNSIVCKSRHYLTNFYVCVQHPYQCPRALRSQCSHVMLFATKDKKLLEELGTTVQLPVDLVVLPVLYRYSRSRTVGLVDASGIFDFL